MGFMEAYKSLEKLCGEIYGESHSKPHGVT